MKRVRQRSSFVKLGYRNQILNYICSFVYLIFHGLALFLSVKNLIFMKICFSSSCHSNQSKTAFHVNKVLTIQGSTCTQHIAQNFPILNISENLILLFEMKPVHIYNIKGIWPHFFQHCLKPLLAECKM